MQIARFEARVAHDRSAGLGSTLNQIRRLYLRGKHRQAQAAAAGFLRMFDDHSLEATDLLVRLASGPRMHRHYVPGEVVHPAGQPMDKVRVLTDGVLLLVDAQNRPKDRVEVGETIALAGALGGPATRLGLTAPVGAGVLELPRPLVTRLLRAAPGYRRVVDAAVRCAFVRSMLPRDGGFRRFEAHTRESIHQRFAWRGWLRWEQLFTASARPGMMVLVVEGTVRFDDGRAMGPGAVLGWVEQDAPSIIGARSDSTVTGLVLTRSAFRGALAAAAWAA